MKNSKHIFIATLVVAAFALASFLIKETPSSTVAATPVSQLVADWERAKAYTKEYIDAASEEAIGFKPTPEMRSFGQQMLHITEVNYILGATATGKTTTVTFGQFEKSDKYKTKAEVLKAAMESYDFVIAAIKEMNEQQMGDMVKVFNFDMNKATALEKTFEHQTHHRGQTTVYLRLKGITPPQEKLF